MKRFRKTLSLLIIVLFSVSMLTVTGCGWKPSEEDIKALEETKAAALAAEKTLEEKKAERMDLEKKVQAKKAELEKAKADKEKVKMHVEEQQSGM
jgi:multidrug resistance efflux pump